MHKRKFVQYLSKYVRGLNADQVSSRLLAGELELRDAELEVAPLNELLALGHAPFIIEILAASCDVVKVQAPWSSLRSRPVRVQFGDIRLQVKIHPREDLSWTSSSAERVEVALAEAAARCVPDTEACQGSASPSVKLSEVKVAVLDGLHVSVASVRLLLLQPQHPQTGCLDAGLLRAWELQLTDFSLQPRACGRQRNDSWTTLRRRFELGAAELHAASLAAQRGSSISGGSKALPMMSLRRVVLDLSEGRDVGRRHHLGSEKNGGPAAMAAGSARMAGFPRELRASLHLPDCQLHCGSQELEALSLLARELASTPGRPDLERLQPEVRERIARAAAAAAAGVHAKAKTGQKMPFLSRKKNRNPEDEVDDEDYSSRSSSAMAAAAAAAGRTAANSLAHKAALTAGAASSAGSKGAAAAASSARRTAVAAAQGANSAAAAAQKGYTG
ncbi:unnamed protein product, partial [Polarella glacialis]